jgi:hypothetical protein
VTAELLFRPVSSTMGQARMGAYKLMKRNYAKAMIRRSAVVEIIVCISINAPCLLFKNYARVQFARSDGIVVIDNLTIA